MPYLNIRVNRTLEAKQKQQLFASSTDLMDRLMGKRREVTVVQIEESPATQWAVNGSSLTASQPVAVYTDIKITAGSNSGQQKAQMIEATIAMLRENLGEIQEACYVVIDEIPAASWGFDGKTQAARLSGQL